MNFATIFQAEFHNLDKQFYKGGLKFDIMKNIASSNKGDVRLLTIVSSIIAIVLHLFNPKEVERSFQLNVKRDRPIISHKINNFSFNLADVSCQIAFFMFDVSV
jgi:hypothetical protein